MRRLWEWCAEAMRALGAVMITHPVAWHQVDHGSEGRPGCLSAWEQAQWDGAVERLRSGEIPEDQE